MWGLTPKVSRMFCRHNQTKSGTAKLGSICGKTHNRIYWRMTLILSTEQATHCHFRHKFCSDHDQRSRTQIWVTLAKANIVGSKPSNLSGVVVSHPNSVQDLYPHPYWGSDCLCVRELTCTVCSRTHKQGPDLQNGGSSLEPRWVFFWSLTGEDRSQHSAPTL